MQINSIEIELGYKCNLSCPLCTRNKLFYDNKHVKFNTELDYEYLILFLETMKPKTVKLVGAICEPTLYPHFIKLLEYLNSKNIYVWLSTNGSTKNELFWKHVAIHIPENSTINFDIDHTDQIKQQTYRRGSNLNKILNNIRIVQNELKILNKKINLFALRIDFDWNKDNYDEFIYTAKNIWKIDVYNIPCYNFSQEEFKEDVSLYSHRKQFLYNRLDKLDSTKFAKRQEITCEAFNIKSIYLNCFGDIIPCCYINDLIFKEDNSLFGTEKSIRANYNFPKFYSIYDKQTYIEIKKNIEEVITLGTTTTSTQEENKTLCECCRKFCSKNKRKMFNVMDLDP